MNDKEALTLNIARLHTTALGETRIRHNLSLETANVIEWCKQSVLSPGARATRKGKNYYVISDGCVITINAGSFTIITAHRERSL